MIGRTALLSAVIAFAAAAGANPPPAKLLGRVPPKYPAGASAEGLPGCVLVSFDLSPEGRPRNFRIEDSIPAGIFDQVAVNALHLWQYAAPPPACEGRYFQAFDFSVAKGGEPQTACRPVPADACPIDTSETRNATK